MHRDRGRRRGTEGVEAVRVQGAARSLPYRARLVHHANAATVRRAAIDHSTVCDCACFAVEGGAVPTLSRPLSFYLELTPACNNRCPACANAFVAGAQRAIIEKRPPLPAAGWRQVIEALRLSACRFNITGGEPTLHAEFAAILEHLATCGIPFTLFTNGRWHDTGRLLNLLCASPTFEGMLVSLHGSNAAAHQAFTAIPGSFDDTIGNVRAAVERDIPVALSCAITIHNWSQIGELVTLARQLGTDGVVFDRYLGTPTAGLAPTPAQLRTAIAQVEALRASGAPVKLGNCVPACFMRTTQSGCLAGVAFLTIDPWGRARPCNHAPDIVGQVPEQSVDLIWHSPEMEAWRQAQSAACIGCALVDTCRGGCHALAAAEPSARDPLMRAPLSAVDEPGPVEVCLYSGSRPVARFMRHTQASGHVLLHRNQLFVATHADQAALDLLDGEKTIGEVKARCGQRGIDMIASLYHAGLIDLL